MHIAWGPNEVWRTAHITVDAVGDMIAAQKAASPGGKKKYVDPNERFKLDQDPSVKTVHEANKKDAEVTIVNDSADEASAARSSNADTPSHDSSSDSDDDSSSSDSSNLSENTLTPEKRTRFGATSFADDARSKETAASG